MRYTIIRKFYKSVKDMNPDNPYNIVDIWVEDGCEPLTYEQAKIMLPKLMVGEYWINEIKEI